eukprot:CAMPEP_0117456076 /NCGR_PEP_ID=MMETSP0759-20121206/11690_1 /TAXON_ID=63605 /ORGANISM="Percolomonas cosmopolitus, Strain WS" /LENGTH=397 /DNA_ID=CAMNT_0005249403 /DNA_START=165 /DNA_END=1358 /DNA_ORIENTATION=+
MTSATPVQKAALQSSFEAPHSPQHHPIFKCNLQYIPCVNCQPSTIPLKYAYPDPVNHSIVRNITVQMYLEEHINLRKSNQTSVKHHLYHRLHQFYLEYLLSNSSEQELMHEFQRNLAADRRLVNNEVDRTTAAQYIKTKWDEVMEPIYFSQWESMLKNERQQQIEENTSLLNTAISEFTAQKSGIISPEYAKYFQDCHSYLPPLLQPLVKIVIQNIQKVADVEQQARSVNQLTQLYRESLALMQHEKIVKFLSQLKSFEEIYGEKFSKHLVHCRDVVQVVTSSVASTELSAREVVRQLNLAAGFLKTATELPALMSKTHMDSLMVQQIVFAYFENMKLPPAYVMQHFKSCMEILEKTHEENTPSTSPAASKDALRTPFEVHHEPLFELSSVFVRLTK